MLQFGPGMFDFTHGHTLAFEWVVNDKVFQMKLFSVKFFISFR